MKNKKHITQVQNWNFDNSYSKLSSKFYKKQVPAYSLNPEQVCFNDELANYLNLDFLLNNKDKRKQILSGNKLPQGSYPIAQAYAGHQFGNFVILGDGRAILIGEHLTSSNNRYDIQLKGAGITQFSRGGDGKATLSSMLREYLFSESMFYLNIPTTRSLAVMKTGEKIYRNEINDGAILTRIASSHIRVGTFEYISTFCSKDEFKLFTHYVIKRHYPELQSSSNPIIMFLKSVIKKQINLIVEWFRVGFIHGVMNTDNMSIIGETIDYGPCSFMNAYNPRTVFSSIDTKGRYAFGNQSRIGHWNLSVFASTLLPLISEDIDYAKNICQEIINEYPKLFLKDYYNMMFNKLGIIYPKKSDKKIVDDLISIMTINKLDYTNTFAILTFKNKSYENYFKSKDIINWCKNWEDRIKQLDNYQNSIELMEKNNPKKIPRNYLVESVINNAINGNLSEFFNLLDQIKSAYNYDNNDFVVQEVPNEFDLNYKTFCGT